MGVFVFLCSTVQNCRFYKKLSTVVFILALNTETKTMCLIQGSFLILSTKFIC